MFLQKLLEQPPKKYFVPTMVVGTAVQTNVVGTAAKGMFVPAKIVLTVVPTMIVGTAVPTIIVLTAYYWKSCIEVIRSSYSISRQSKHVVPMFTIKWSQQNSVD